MNTNLSASATLAGWYRTHLVGFTDEGACLVALGVAQTLIECDVLQTSDLGGLQLSVGEEVMVWLSGAGDRGVILGRIGSAKGAGAGEGRLNHIVLEAAKSLTLQCGDGSITMRGDGKVLIKGKEVVSRAEGMNRLKGGAVAIN